MLRPTLSERLIRALIGLNPTTVETLPWRNSSLIPAGFMRIWTTTTQELPTLYPVIVWALSNEHAGRDIHSAVGPERANDSSDLMQIPVSTTARTNILGSQGPMR